MSDKKGGYFVKLVQIAISIVKSSWSVLLWGRNYNGYTDYVWGSQFLTGMCQKFLKRFLWWKHFQRESREHVGKDVRRERERDWNQSRVQEVSAVPLCRWPLTPICVSVAGDSGTVPALTQDSSFDRLPAIHLFKEAGRRGRIDLSCQLLEKHQGLSGKKWREIN